LSEIEEFITGEVKAYDERTKETSLGTHYTIKYDVEVSSPDDLVGDIHVLMEGYDKTGTLEDGNTIQFDKSKSEFSGRKFKTNAVQNIDTLQWFKVIKKDVIPPPPPKIPWKLIIIGVVVAVVVIGVALASMSPTTLQLSNDKAKYPMGDIMILTAVVTPPSQTIVFYIEDSSGATIKKFNSIAPSNGIFQTKLKLDAPQYQPGAYSIYAEYGTASDQISFSITGFTLASKAKVNIPQKTSVPGCETTQKCYDPYSVPVRIGGVVTWNNIDTVVHTVTSGNPHKGPDGAFDSSLIMSGDTFSHKFNSVGIYDYFCMLHPWMLGKVTVK